MKSHKVTLKISDTNMKHLKEIAARFKAQGNEEMSSVEALIEYCVFASFHALDVDSYPPEEHEPVAVNITGIVAVPPGAAKSGDVRGASQQVLGRMINAFPHHRLNVEVSAPSPKSKKVEEWRRAL